MNTERLTVLVAFIRNQANLTDSKKPVPGPGCVQLNNAEAMEVVEAIESLLPVARCSECGLRVLPP